MAKPEFGFKEIRPDRTILLNADTVVVNRAGLRISATAYTRMGYPESIKIEVSEDKRAVRLSIPGPFQVRILKSTHGDKYRPGAIVSSVAITRTAPKGLYKHAGDNIFVLE